METPIRDLTVHIARTEHYHLYLGRYAEIWKAQYSYYPVSAQLALLVRFGFSNRFLRGWLM